MFILTTTLGESYLSDFDSGMIVSQLNVYSVSPYIDFFPYLFSKHPLHDCYLFVNTPRVVNLILAPNLAAVLCVTCLPHFLLVHLYLVTAF